MKKYNLNDYLIRLNKLLQENDFVEKFVAEKYKHEENEYDHIVLYNLEDKLKFISIMSECGDYDGVIFSYYKWNHTHYDFFDDSSIEELVESIFERIKEIMNNEIVAYTNKTIKIGHVSGVSPFFADVNSFNYTKKEKDFLTKNDMEFQLWSSTVTENMKLFIIGAHYTNMPEITSKWKKYLNT